MCPLWAGAPGRGEPDVMRLPVPPYEPSEDVGALRRYAARVGAHDIAALTDDELFAYFLARWATILAVAHHPATRKNDSR